MVSEQNQRIIEKIKRSDLTEYRNLYNLLAMAKNVLQEDSTDLEYCLRISRFVKNQVMSLKQTIQLNDLYWDTLLFEAPYLVDSYFRYIERDDKPNKRFYQPRAKVLKPIIDAYQELYDGKLDLLSVSQPKRTGKTTSALRLISMMSGRNPSGSTLAVGSGNGLVNSFHGGMLELYTTPNSRVYDVFPDAKLVRTKADEMIIDLEKQSRFPTITSRSVDGQIVGSTEANNLLYLDDTVKNHEEAMNRTRLEFLCEKVAGDVLGRRIEGTPILIQGTKYSLYDPITFLQNKATEMNWRWKEVAIPALDENDNSNFTIYLDGRYIFTTEYYRNERKLVTEEVWEAEFQQRPFEAKGQMFPEKDLNRYFELPTDRDADAVIAVCDTAEDGADSTSMPVAYLYGDDVFIEDVVFDNSPPDITKPQCAKMLRKHNVGQATFESNNAGTYYARDVEKLVKGLGGKTSIRTKRTISNKLTRIEIASDNIKKNFYFKDKSLYTPNSQYGRFMKEVTSMTRSGKVPHDDAPDSLSLLENVIRGLKGGKTTVSDRFF